VEPGIEADEVRHAGKNAQGFAHDRVIYLLDLVDEFRSRIFEMIFAGVEERVNNDEAIFGDCARQHRAALLAVKRRNV